MLRLKHSHGGAMLAVALLLAGFLTAAAQEYKAVEVKAPFPMEPIKEFVFPDRKFPITDFGAVEGDSVVNTAAIESAVTACHEAGGGWVVVPAGEWWSGPIHLMDNVNLRLSEGSVLRFTDQPEAYLPAVPVSWEGIECYNYSPLIYAYGCENVAITGCGMICPEMDTWQEWFDRGQAHLNALAVLYSMAEEDAPVEQRQMAKGENHLRPHLIHFNRCKNIRIDGIKIRESPFWTIHLYLCDNAIVRRLDVKAHGRNNDGIDIEMSRNVLVENCIFDQGDDAVSLKAGRNRDGWRIGVPTENVVVRNCSVQRGHSLLGIGSEVSAGVRNVYMHDCTASNALHRFFFIKTNHRRGGFVENVYMERVEAAAALSVFEIDTDVLYQWRYIVPTHHTRITHINHIHLHDLGCDAVKTIYELKGDKRAPVQDVEMTNIHVRCVADSTNHAVNVENLQVAGVHYHEVNPDILPQLNRYIKDK